MKKPYRLQPEHMRKLRDLNKEQVNLYQAHISAWNNGEFDRAKEIMRQANIANANLVAYHKKLVGWQEEGVPCDYAR